MKNTKNTKETQLWINKTKKQYNIIKSLKIEHLKTLIDLAELEPRVYKTKSMMAKGLMMKLGGVLPIELQNWK